MKQKRTQTEYLTELDELTDDKDLESLKTELNFQLLLEETEGGTICSHIKHILQTSNENTNDNNNRFRR